MNDKTSLILVQEEDIDMYIRQIAANSKSIRRIRFAGLTFTQFERLAIALEANTHVCDVAASIDISYPLGSRQEMRLVQLLQAIEERVRINRTHGALPSLSVLAARVIARHKIHDEEIPEECKEKIKAAVEEMDAPNLSKLIERKGKRFF